MRPKEKLLFLECHVAGRQYHEACEVWDKLDIGTELFLELDKENRHDPKAVAICYRDPADNREYCLGYVPREQNETIADFLEMGHADIFDCRLNYKNGGVHYEQQLRIVIKIKRRNA